MKNINLHVLTGELTEADYTPAEVEDATRRGAEELVQRARAAAEKAAARAEIVAEAVAALKAAP